MLPSPEAFLIALFIVSFGIFAALHFAITSFNFEFPAGSGPPAFTATNSSLPNFVNTFPLAASAFPFFACMLLHLECPLIFCSSSSLSFSKIHFLFYHIFLRFGSLLANIFIFSYCGRFFSRKEPSTIRKKFTLPLSSLLITHFL